MSADRRMNWPECDKCSSSTCCGGCREPEEENAEMTETLEQKAARLESERDGVSEMLKEAVQEKEERVSHLQQLLVAARDERDALRESVDVKRMVDRFLQWKLPENFNPDGGISFKQMRNENTPWPAKNEPVGTNLLDAQQAEEMIRFILRQG